MSRSKRKKKQKTKVDVAINANIAENVEPKKKVEDTYDLVSLSYTIYGNKKHR